MIKNERKNDIERKKEQQEERKNDT